MQVGQADDQGHRVTSETKSFGLRQKRGWTILTIKSYFLQPKFQKHFLQNRNMFQKLAPNLSNARKSQNVKKILMKFEQ